VCGREEVAARPDLGVAATGWKSSANICSISTSRMNFSNDALSPPSSQPAACSTK
jgi:hypothetical protein